MTDIRAWGLVAWAAVAGGCAWYVTEADRRRAADRDGDGFASVRWGDGTDCDDDNPQIHPAAAELCGDNVDNNCDGATDDFGVGNVIWYSDADGDGFGLDEATGQACATHDFAGFTRQGGDCNDRADGIHPGADDSDCDGVDDDCSGVPDDTDLQHYLDADGDGFGDPASPVDACDGLPNTSVTNTDCDDTNAQVYPEALEICDGVDNSCNGKVDDEAAATVNASVNHASVGAAIEAALASNTPATVHVCAGDHTIETVSVRSLDDLTVVGAAGRDATTLRPPNGETVFEVRNTGVLTLEGLEVTGASEDPAIWVTDQGRLTVLSSHISDNDQYGLLIEGAGAVATLEASTLDGNTGRKGGIFDLQSGGAIHAADSFELIVDSCVFTNNFGQVGGGIGLSNSAKGSPSASATITNSVFSNNEAGVLGGAVSAFGEIDVKIIGSELTQNIATYKGSAIVANLLDATTLDIEGSSISDNDSPGAALLITSGEVTLVDSSVTNHVGVGAELDFTANTNPTISLLSIDTDWGRPDIDDNIRDIVILQTSQTSRSHDYSGVNTFICDWSDCRYYAP